MYILDLYNKTSAINIFPQDQTQGFFIYSIDFLNKLSEQLMNNSQNIINKINNIYISQNIDDNNSNYILNTVESNAIESNAIENYNYPKSYNLLYTLHNNHPHNHQQNQSIMSYRCYLHVINNSLFFLFSVSLLLGFFICAFNKSAVKNKKNKSSETVKPVEIIDYNVIKERKNDDC